MSGADGRMHPTGGIFINLHSFTACSLRFLPLDRARTRSSLYLHAFYERVPNEPSPIPSEGNPTKLALGVPGGFDLQAPPSYTVTKTHSLLVFSEPPQTLEASVALSRGHKEDTASLALSPPFYLFPDYPSPQHSELPEFLAGVVTAVLAHEEKNSSAASASSAAWEEQVLPSPYAPLLVPRPDPATGLPRYDGFFYIFAGISNGC